MSHAAKMMSEKLKEEGNKLEDTYYTDAKKERHELVHA